jgi:hypothetical protein
MKFMEQVTILRISGQVTGFIDHAFEAVRVAGGVHTVISDARRFEKDVLLNMGDDQATVRSILAPLSALQGVAVAWGDGDLRCHMQQGGSDELSQVMQGMGRMQGQRVRLVAAMAALSLQKTSASVEQLSVTVKRTTASAGQAVQRSQHAVRHTPHQFGHGWH